MINDKLYGPVKKGELIGEGAQGKVFRGLLVNTGKFIAVKEITIKPNI
jgi:hypothetical protein